MLTRSILFSCFGCFYLISYLVAPANSSDKCVKKLSHFVNNFNFKINEIIARKEQGGNYMISAYSLTKTIEQIYMFLTENEQKKIDATLSLMEGELQNCMFHLENELKSKSFQDVTAVWLSTYIHVKKELKEKFDQIERMLSGNMKRIDFTTAHPEEFINTWVKNKTNGMITNLLSKEIVSPATTVVLTNAVTFLGNWKTPFDSKLTTTHEFFVQENKTVNIQMMANTLNVNVYFEKNFNKVFLELPYENNEFLMYLFMTKDASKFDSINFDEMVKKLNKRKCQILLPKFQISSKLFLRGVFSELGFQNLFKKISFFDESVYFNQIIHQSKIIVDEKGTKASSATAAVGQRSALPRIIFNHPFYFLIKHAKLNLVIFQGYVETPEQVNK